VTSVLPVPGVVFVAVAERESPYAISWTGTWRARDSRVGDGPVLGLDAAARVMEPICTGLQLIKPIDQPQCGAMIPPPASKTNAAASGRLWGGDTLGARMPDAWVAALCCSTSAENTVRWHPRQRTPLRDMLALGPTGGIMTKP
jgi:hypothetical protein